MRTIRTKVYSFNELNKEGQQKAIELNSDINVLHDWWFHTYDDAKTAGLKLTSFDLDRNKHAKGEFIESSYDCASKIIKNHGETCDSYALAKQFIEEWDEAVLLYSDGFKTDKVMDGKEYYFDNYISDREDLFLNEILSYYANYLQKECDYLQTDEAIKETLITNDYEFLSNGEMINL